jgi:hypothetical protein
MPGERRQLSERPARSSARGGCCLPPPAVCARVCKKKAAAVAGRPDTAMAALARAICSPSVSSTTGGGVLTSLPAPQDKSFYNYIL